MENLSDSEIIFLICGIVSHIISVIIYYILYEKGFKK